MSFPESVIAFLHKVGWDTADPAPLCADLSPRQFTRLQRPSGTPRTAILMQAPPEQKTPQFVALSSVLRRCGLNAPEIVAAQPEDGLVLMEDFGDTTLGKLLDTRSPAALVYQRGTDVLVRLHQRFQADMVEGLNLPLFKAAFFTDQVELFLDGYFPSAYGRAADIEERESFRAAWLQVLAPLDSAPQTLLLRDYMPDNLMNRPGQTAPGNVGLLDFQDGGRGPMAYDLASLCETVRRDGGLHQLDDVLTRYLAQNPVMDFQELRQAAHILAAQRHARILGIVANLVRIPEHQPKRAYLPRLWLTLHALLQDAPLAPIKKWFKDYFPSHEHT
ncbi:MAG: phosphotransferase [Alphaproteobacteria bacterium]|nr:phosphotransferase [Alphaproteobacteria bacterium]